MEVTGLDQACNMLETILAVDPATNHSTCAHLLLVSICVHVHHVVPTDRALLAFCFAARQVITLLPRTSPCPTGRPRALSAGTRAPDQQQGVRHLLSLCSASLSCGCHIETPSGGHAGHVCHAPSVFIAMQALARPPLMARLAMMSCQSLTYKASMPQFPFLQTGRFIGDIHCRGAPGRGAPGKPCKVNPH